MRQGGTDSLYSALGAFLTANMLSDFLVQKKKVWNA